jgi:hypothetical protein
MTEQPTTDEMFLEISKIFAKMRDVIQSQDAQIRRIEFRLDRLEKQAGIK